MTYHYIGCCSVCDAPVIAKGLCTKHYARLRRTGTVVTTQRTRDVKTIQERFEARVQKLDNGCWEIPGGRLGPGYSTIWWGKPLYAHRVAYELYIGSIPSALEIDHLCRNRACCNPAHLEAVTHKENMHRSPLVFKHGRRVLSVEKLAQRAAYERARKAGAM